MLGTGMVLLFKEVRQEEIFATQSTDTANKLTVTIEEWAYNLGSDRLIRIFESRNGKLTGVRTGGYGQ